MRSKNAPCVCGSGKKYKNCCLPQERQRAVDANRHAPAVSLREKSVLGVFLFALTLRLALFFQMRDSILAKVPILDGAYYYAWAQRIVAGDWLGGTGVYQMSPGYPYLLAGLFKIFGSSLANVTVVQCLVSALSCVVTYLIARRFYSAAFSALAGLLLASCGASVFYSNILNKAPWVEFLNSILLLTLFHALAATSPWSLLVPGLLLGVSSQFRPSILLFLPLAAACVWFHDGPSLAPKLKITRLWALILGVSLVIVPVALRNRMVGGELVLTTSHGGMNFYTGNVAQSAAPYRPPPFARSDPQYEQSDFLTEAQRRAGRNLTPAEASRFWYAEAGRLIRGDIAGWLAILVKKFRLLWSNYEQPINQNIYFYGENFALLKVLSFVGYWLIAPLGLLGLLISLRNRSLLPLHFYFLAQVVSLLAFFVVSEYRHPMTTVLAIYAACALEWLRTQIHAAAWRRLGLAFAFLILVGTSTRSSTKDAVGSRQDMAVAYGNLGSTYMVQERWEQAVSALRRSLSILPDFGEAHYTLGECLLNQNKSAEAKFHLLEGMRLRPELAPQHYRLLLAQAYSQSGEWDKAIGELKTVLSLNPNDTPSRLNLILIYRQLGKKGEAEALLAKMLSSDSSNSRVLILATQLAISDNDKIKIFELLPRLASAAPNDPDVRNLIGMALVKTGHYREAKVEFERALTLMPGHKAAVANLQRLNW